MSEIRKREVISFMWMALVFLPIFAANQLCRRILFLRRVEEVFPISIVIGVPLALFIVTVFFSRSVDKLIGLKNKEWLNEVKESAKEPE